jgi:hypothetical protein
MVSVSLSIHKVSPLYLLHFTSLGERSSHMRVHPHPYIQECLIHGSSLCRRGCMRHTSKGHLARCIDFGLWFIIFRSVCSVHYIHNKKFISVLRLWLKIKNRSLRICPSSFPFTSKYYSILYSLVYYTVVLLCDVTCIMHTSYK